MKKLIIWIIVFLFLIQLVNADPLLVKKINFADSSTATATFVNIDTQKTFTLNKTADLDFIVSLTSRLSGGGQFTSTEVDYRILLDNVNIVERRRLLRERIVAGDNRYFWILGSANDVSAGTHIIDFQHQTLFKTLNSENIDFVINTNTLTNTTLLNRKNFEFIAIVDEGLNPINSGTFETKNQANIISLINVNLNLSAGFRSTFIISVDNENSSSFKLNSSSFAPQPLGYYHTFFNKEATVHNFTIYGETIGVGTQRLEFNLVLIESVADGISLSNNHTNPNNITVGTEFTEIGNISINIQEQSDILTFATIHLFSSTLTDKVIQLKLNITGESESPIRQERVFNFQQGILDFIHLPMSNLFEDLSAGTKIVRLFAKTDVETIDIRNISVTVIEADDYDTNIIIPPNQFKAAEDRSVNDTPFLIKKLDFVDSSTVSSTYVSIGSFGFNINISDTNANFFSSLEAELTAVATDGSGIASWRILVDGETISEVNRDFLDTSNGDIGSVVLFGQLPNLAVGFHTVDLQHKVTNEQINSKDITFFVNQDTLTNNSRINRNLFDFNLSYSSTSFIEVASGTFNTDIDQDIFTIIDINVSTPSGTRQEFFYQLDGINSGHFKRFVTQLPEDIHLGYTNLFGDIPSGLHIWRVFARNVPFSTSTFTGTGKIAFIELKSDGLTLNFNTLVVEEQKDISEIFLEIARLELDVPDQSDITVFVSGTLDTNTTPLTVNRDTLIDFEIRTDVGTLSRSINLLGSNGSDTGKRFYNFFASDIFENFNLGKTNISLFAKATPEKLNIINLTFSVFEVEDYDLSIQVPVFPTVNIISPKNNTRNNTHPINITFIANNDAALFLDCTLRNASTVFDQGSFPNNVTSNLLLDTGLIEIDQRFDLEIICFDNGVVFNLSSSAFLSNLTLDNIDPIITIISPQDLEKFNKDITGSINVNAECTDSPVFKFNITITNATDTIFSAQDLSPSANKLTIDESLDISDVGIGTYTVDYLCSDPHTSSQIDNYNIKKNTSENKIKWVSPSLNEYEIKYDVPMKNGINATDFGTYKNDIGDRYIFYYIMDAVDDGTERTFTFELENKKQEVNYIADSGYKAHFVMENNWIDFEFNDPDATYLVTLNGQGNYEIEITTTKTILNFSSTGELNTVTLQTTFSIGFKKQIKEGIFNIATCPLQNLQTTILFMFFILLSFGIMIIGFNWQIGVVGALGSILLIIISVFAYACVIAVGIVLSGIGVILLVMFTMKGARNFA